MEIADISPEKDDYYVVVVEHRKVLARIYQSLPDVDSPVFWEVVERADLPLEILVLCLRNLTDHQQRQRLLHIIVQRTQIMNEYWAARVLKHLVVSVDERQTFICDLCADLYEHMIRALLDPRRLFWEENFLHSLSFERKHVYRSFMMREGRWHDERIVRSERVPRALLLRLDQPISLGDDENYLLELEDEHAQMMFQAIETSDLLRLVFLLPEHLKLVLLLLYWEGHTEKETARLLGISDRTVRNRRRGAIKILRGFLIDPMEGG